MIKHVMVDTTAFGEFMNRRASLRAARTSHVDRVGLADSRAAGKRHAKDAKRHSAG